MGDTLSPPRKGALSLDGLMEPVKLEEFFLTVWEWFLPIGLESSTWMGAVCAGSRITISIRVFTLKSLAVVKLKRLSSEGMSLGSLGMLDEEFPHRAAIFS